MRTLLPLLAIVGLLTLSMGCHHTTKKYYEEDRVIERDHGHRDYHDRDGDHDHRGHDHH